MPYYAEYGTCLYSTDETKRLSFHFCADFQSERNFQLYENETCEYFCSTDILAPFLPEGYHIGDVVELVKTCSTPPPNLQVVTIPFREEEWTIHWTDVDNKPHEGTLEIQPPEAFPSLTAYQQVFREEALRITDNAGNYTTTLEN